MERPVLATLLACLAAGLLAFPVRWLVLRFGVVDRPNDRSSHEIPTPRGGGLAIVLGVVLTVPWFVSPERAYWILGLCVAAVALVSIVDDFRSLSFATRLAIQGGAAVVAVVALGVPVRSIDLPAVAVALPAWLGLVIAVLFVVAYSNFFNFMDGINGIAATQAVVSATTLAMLFQQAGDLSGAVVAGAIAGAAAGFLPHNFPAARIFMGDVGSVTLGFALAVLSMIAHTRGGVPWPALLLIHGAFLFDTVFTLIKRLLRGENVVRPHREHNYQLLIRGGKSHFAVTSTYGVISAGCCIAGYLYATNGPAFRWGALALPLLGLSTLAVWAHRSGPLPVASPAATMATATRSGAS